MERTVEQKAPLWLWEGFVGAPDKRAKTSKRLMNLFMQYSLTDWRERSPSSFSGRKPFVVLDVGCGTGRDAIFYSQHGLVSVCKEIDIELCHLAQRNANAAQVPIIWEGGGSDWRDEPSILSLSSYDAVVCSGNSLTYLFDEVDRRRAIEGFVKKAKPGAVVLIDQRNYDYMLREREHILENPRKNFRYGGEWYYCGIDKVAVYPSIIEHNLVRLEYLQIASGEKGHLDVYPLKREELTGLMREAGLDVKVFADFEPIESAKSPETADFFQQVGIKPLT